MPPGRRRELRPPVLRDDPNQVGQQAVARAELGAQPDVGEEGGRPRNHQRDCQLRFMPDASGTMNRSRRLGRRVAGGFAVGLSSKDRKLLWGRARNICAFPQCRQSLTPDQVDAKTGESFQTVVGEEAHIYSASPDGPRYDPKYPFAKLETYENRILLCGVHHTCIDAEGGRAYDAETLLAMKKRHEQQEDRRSARRRRQDLVSAGKAGGTERRFYVRRCTVCHPHGRSCRATARPHRCRPPGRR
jgi:hypothetical protein